MTRCLSVCLSVTRCDNTLVFCWNGRMNRTGLRHKGCLRLCCNRILLSPELNVLSSRIPNSVDRRKRSQLSSTLESFSTRFTKTLAATQSAARFVCTAETSGLDWLILRRPIHIRHVSCATLYTGHVEGKPWSISVSPGFLYDELLFVNVLINVHRLKSGARTFAPPSDNHITRINVPGF